MRGLPGPLSRATAIAMVALSVPLVLAGPGAFGAVRAASTPAGDSSWTVYHGDAAGSGVSNSVAAVATSARAWSSPALDGQLYGEPLVSGADVYVATEDDTVYALSSSSGAVVWSTHIASPVPASALPCGDITPSVGITGTPVIDPARSEIFVEMCIRDRAWILLSMPGIATPSRQAALRKLIKYGSVSAISTATSLTILGVLVGIFSFPAIWANVIATAIATVPSFCLLYTSRCV